MPSTGRITSIDLEGWAPEHAAAEQASENTGQSSSPASAKTIAKKGEDSLDPEPDEAIKIPAVQPSTDPIDRKTAPATDASNSDPLPPRNAAIKAALDKRDAAPVHGPNAAETRKQQKAVAFFYAAHGFAPAWSEDNKAAAAVDPVLKRLAAAEDDALKLPTSPTELKLTGTPEEIAESDLVLTEAVVAYARQATGSRVDLRAISPLIGAKPDLADPAEVVDSLIAAGPEAGDKLHALNPSEPRYIALRDKLAELRGNKTQTSDIKIEPGPTLRSGMSDPRVPGLRASLGLPAKPDGDDDNMVYDAELAAAVTKFQREQGIRPSGVLNDRTVAALGGAAKTRSSSLETTIVANMEIWRWLPRELGADRIEVNIPDYVVKVYHDNMAVAANRVVVGKTETPTPIFSNTMKYLIVNPVWNVPQSIIKNEMNGEARGFKARYVHGQLYLQQPPGPKNALGRIKFMFPNDYSVYLHDTPSKALFSASKRAYSHGCVRVDKPFDFAHAVLNNGVSEGGKPLWSEQRLEKMLGPTERYVDLPKPLPIHIEYFTASVDESGQVVTRPDVYGYTGAVAAALGIGGGAGSVPVAGRAKRDSYDAAQADADTPGERRPRRSRSAAARRLAEERAEERGRQAYAPPPETGRTFFGFLPF